MQPKFDQKKYLKKIYFLSGILWYGKKYKPHASGLSRLLSRLFPLEIYIKKFVISPVIQLFFKITKLIFLMLIRINN
jgi:hypothetical protein